MRRVITETPGRMRGRGRYAGGARVARGGGGSGGLLALARLIQGVTGFIAGLIVVAILLRVLGANPSNDLVQFITDLARGFVGPFRDLFDLDDAKLQMALNWGLAALAWSVVGGWVAGVLARSALRD